MTAELDVRRLLIDAIPAALVVALAAVVMSSQIEELGGKLVVLVIAGLVGIGLSSLLLRRPSVIPVSVSPTVADQPTLVVPPGNAWRPPTQAGAPVEGSPVKGLESFSLAKEGAETEENEDSFAANAHTGTIAVSDGASSSFGSRVWSRALVDVAAASTLPLAPSFVGEVMTPSAQAWKQHHEAGDLPWWAVEGLRRGGFATLLVVRIGRGREGRAWQSLAVGDSCLFHMRKTKSGWGLVRAFPLDSAEAFGSHPVLLSSVSPPPVEGIELAGGLLVAGDILIAATDAVSEWLLGDPQRLTFAVQAPIGDIADVVSAARRSREMVNDDATFVRYVERR